MTVLVIVVAMAQDDIVVMELAADVDVIDFIKHELAVAGPGLVPFMLSYRPHMALGAVWQATSRQIASSTGPADGTTVTGGLHL